MHHFTLADQVDQLVSASEAEPDLGFMARLLTLYSLPRTNPGDGLQYKLRQRAVHPDHDGHRRVQATLRPAAALVDGLALVLEAVRTQSPVISSGNSLTEFMRTLGIYSS